MPHHTRRIHPVLLELFEQPSLAERSRRIIHGLHQPRNTGEYRRARLALALARSDKVVAARALLAHAEFAGATGTASDAAASVQRPPVSRYASALLRSQVRSCALELRARDRERKLVAKIELALERIEDGTYGFCAETGKPIGLKRLEARPIADLSIEAQERHEQEESRGARG